MPRLPLLKKYDELYNISYCISFFENPVLTYSNTNKYITGTLNKGANGEKRVVLLGWNIGKGREGQGRAGQGRAGQGKKGKGEVKGVKR